MTQCKQTPFTLGTLHHAGTDFQALIEHSADLITVLDASGHLLYQSPSARQLFGSGQPLSEETARTNLDHLHPDDRGCLQRVLDAPPGIVVTLRPYRMQTVHGQWCWLEGTALNMTAHPQVRGFLIQARDVTPRMLAEERSRSLARLSADLASANTTAEVVRVILDQGLRAAGAAAGGVVLLDQDGQHLNVLGTAGYAERIERPWRRFPLNTPIPAADAVREHRDLFLTREDWCRLYPHLQHVPDPATGSSGVLTLQINGQVTGAITLSFPDDRSCSETDRQHLRAVATQCALALERGQLIAQLQHQERLFRKLTERSGDLVSIIAPNGDAVYISPSVHRLLGFTPVERLGLNVLQGIHPADVHHVMQAYRKAEQTQLPVQVTYRFQHKGGHWVWLESTGINATDDPDLKGMLINTRDVTARVEAEEAHRASERRLQLFGEQSDTLIRIFDPGGACLFVSPAVQSMLGYSPEELLAYGMQELIHPDDQSAVQEAWATHTALPVYRKRRRDGTYLWVESATRKVKDEQDRLIEVHVATRDVTARMEAEEALRLQLRRFQHLVNLTAEFATQEDTEQHIHTALERCLELTPYTYGFFFPVNGDTLINPLRAGQAAEQMVEWTLPLERLHRTGHIGKALRQNQPYFAGPDHAVFSPPEMMPRPVWTSLAVLPVVSRSVLRGFMAFGTNEATEVDDDTRRLLVGVSEQASRAVERSVHLSELKQSREETLRALGLALEYRDYETKGHTDRVLQLTTRLGQALGFTGDDLDALRWGAFLHDTGKVAIPDAILLKPGKLDPGEWDVIKRHPTIGYEMLQHIPSLPPSTLEVVLYHQERWNGSGYPKGLAGPDIPLAARVFAVVDVYDALTSERPYKKAWTHEEASRQLQQEAGTLLDARVVDTFLRLLSTSPSPEVSPHDAA